MTWECDKCGGSGVIPAFGHVAQGMCFKCEGSGRLPYNPAPRGPVAEEDDPVRGWADDADEIGDKLCAECETPIPRSGPDLCDSCECGW